MSAKKGIIDKIRQFDAYPKTLEDFQIKTFSGAAVTVVAAVFMAILMLMEFYDYVVPKIIEEIFVDTTRGSKLKINIDVVFKSVPCHLLSLDAMDLSGEHHINIEHNIFKRRLDLLGNPIQDPEKQHSIGPDENVIASVPPAVNAESDSEAPKCGSCYGAEYGDRKCCNTCDEVREAYKRKGWATPHLSGIEQCVREGKVSRTEEVPKEGCQIFGYIEVNRVAGSFHIAPGKSSQQDHIHVHDVQQYSTMDFDLSHLVRHLSFGTNIPGRTNPIDGTEYLTEKGARNIHYYLKIVPTTYERLDGSTLMTNQFSMTQHDKVLHMAFGESGLPGVFFTYELSPMMVKYTQKKKSLGHFLTGICATIGGVFTVAGLIDGLVYHSQKAIQRKIEIGKVS